MFRLLVPATVGLIARQKSLRWLSDDGAFVGVLIGSIITLTGWWHSAALLTFFVCASVATKIARKGTKTQSLDDDSKTGRNMWQVLAVGGIPALLCLLGDTHMRSVVGISDSSFVGSAFLASNFNTMYTAYLACCCADTLASEFGSLSPKQPFHLFSLKSVPTGTDGAVSGEGMLASVMGGALVGIFAPFISQSSGAFIPLMFYGALRYAIIGSMGALFDSMLGVLWQPPRLKVCAVWL